VGNRNWTKREGNVGDVFDYDNNDQVTVVKLNIANPDTTAPGSQTIHYDTNGNRASFAPYGTTDNYTTNNLNEYTVRNSSSAAYNASADMTTGFDGSTYTYDAQDRLLSATESGVTETFTYDGLNRQVSRTVAGVTTYNVYDGWALIEEYQSGGMTAAYLHGAGGLVKDLTTNNYYYQDGSGSTSHLADSAGNLLEWYRYDLQGTPVFYNFANTQQSASAYSIRHLFTGQQWYAELGLYDLRNRFYSPDIGRFLQPDPVGFNGDATNLYRYCGNNPLTRSDPSGQTVWISQHSVGPGNHTYLTIVPSNPNTFGGSSNLSPQSGALTISGQPVAGPGGYYLNSTINMDTPAYTTVVNPPSGMTAADFDNAVYNSAMSYSDYTNLYFPVPEYANLTSGASGILFYNSNGFTVAMLNESGVDNGQEIVDSLPGWQPGSGYPPPSSGGGITVVGSPLSKNEQAQVRGLARLRSMYNPFWGYLPTTFTTNFAGGIARPGGYGGPWSISTGRPIQGSIFGPGNFYSGLDPVAAVGSTWGEGFRTAASP
jgi:RHS repeat-associated protein